MNPKDPVPALISREQYPVLRNNPEMVYLDSAATALRTEHLLKALPQAYIEDYANVHRGSYSLGERATQRYENSRKKISSMMSIKNHEVIFTHGGTEGMNLIMRSLLGEKRLSPGGRVITSVLEHHSVLLPLRKLCEEKGLELIIIPVKEDGTVDRNTLLREIEKGCSLLCLSLMSNVTGEEIYRREYGKMVRKQGGIVIGDACQYVAKKSLQPRSMNLDACVFSGHKIGSPGGVGVAFLSYEIWSDLPPLMTGGEMVLSVGESTAQYKEMPYRYEAGTPAISEAFLLAEQYEWITEEVGYEAIEQYTRNLTDYGNTLLEELSEESPIIQGLTRKGMNGIWSLYTSLDQHSSHDLSDTLSERGFAVRSGLHCVEPLHRTIGIGSSLRVSIGLHTSSEDLERVFGTLFSLLYE